MRHFAHHIGDYAAATAHLSFVEDAAYHRLLRRYYQDERALPADLAATQRLVGARSKEERAAVEAVLGEFFVLEDDGWHQARADKEIESYRVRADTARQNGTYGGRPPKPKTNPEETQTVPQNKLTNNHKPLTIEEGAQALPRTGSRLSEDWKPSEEDCAFADGLGVAVGLVAPVFRDYWHAVAGAKGRKTNWSATWRNWVRREAESRDKPKAYASKFSAKPDPQALPPTDPWEQRLQGWNTRKQWLPQIWGPPPGEPGCRVPKHLNQEAA